MTRYEIIMSLDDTFTKLMAKKLSPVHILDWKVYYETYNTEKELAAKKRVKSTKTEIATTIAGRYNITERTLYNVIAFMEGE